MIYRFGDFQLDTAKAELRSDGAAVAIEPQVLALLVLLVENTERLVTKDEMIEQVWRGRSISDAAIASRIKSARRAVGDDGRTQRFIRTVHGLGFRFVADVTPQADEPAKQAIIVRAPEILPNETPDPAPNSRPSIAVLRFRHLGEPGPQAGVAEALPADLISELSRLRWLFIISRGSSFQFHGGAEEIGHVRTMLNVRYCLTGLVETTGSTMSVSVELCDAETKGVIWSERFKGSLGAVHDIREEIVRAVINALELQIPMNEARRARLKSPDRLDAWSAYHLGLSHMYRFNRQDNATATTLFERAAELEPDFARAYAGLSFTHFQYAFLRYGNDIAGATKRAEQYADQSLACDPLDPFGAFTKGRFYWLNGDLDTSLAWLERANALAPNYAQAKYSKAWTASLLGDAIDSQKDIDTALSLSPLDPLRYGMLAVRAFTHIMQHEDAPAAEWAEKAARSPGAHVLIEMVATLAHGLNGDDARAQQWARSAHARDPSQTTETFMHAFPFRDAPLRHRVVGTLARYGF